MKYERGQIVVAKDGDGRPHRLKVWAETDRSVFLASEDLFHRLKRGRRDGWPVAVPQEDVHPDRVRFSWKKLPG